MIDVLRLAGFAHQLDLDLGRLAILEKVADRRLYTYIFSYPFLCAKFSDIERITPSDFIAIKAMVYGLMPTTMNLRKGDLEAFLAPLELLKKTGRRLSTEELTGLKAIVNNSVVGTSKILHFLRPDIYPIWDSRINRFLHGEARDTNSVTRYLSYLADFDRVSADPAFEPLRASLESKLNYSVTAARAFEMIMYLADLLKLSYVSPPSVLQPSVPAATKRPKIPRLKRDAYTFISNLGPVTLDPSVPDTLIRDGYLLSERYTTNASLKLAAVARSRRNLLISDNGNWTRMSALARRFNDAGRVLLDRARREEANGGITDSVRVERANLLAKIAEASTRQLAELDLPEIIGTQLRMKPDYMIGLEDFAVPVMIMTGLMDPVFKPNPSEVAPFQARTRELFTRQMAGEFGYKNSLSEAALFMVIHAFDYASAFSGAKAARKVNKAGLAISFGAPMASRRWITKIKLGDKVETLGEKLPESYLAAHVLTLGVINGHDDDIPIHVLGVGTPILVMMLGFLLRRSRAVSIDSSAPMQDAFDGRIYGTRQAFLKMRMYRLASLLLVADVPYESNTLFFKTFNARYPADWRGLRQKLGISASSDPREIERMLENDQVLVQQHIPFFTRLRGGSDPFFWDLRISRAGHNYCVLREIVNHVRRRRNNESALRAWTEREIARYVAVGHPKWARAVEKSFEITLRHILG